MAEDDTKELPLEEKVKAKYKIEFDQSSCKKKNYSKEYYSCKEPEKGPICAYAISVIFGHYVCSKNLKKE